MNKRIARGTMLTVVLVSMLALTISVRITNAVYDPDYDFVPPAGIDGREIAYMARAFGSYLGHPRYNSTLDFNMDDYIDGRDFVMVARSFGPP